MAPLSILKFGSSVLTRDEDIPLAVHAIYRNRAFAPMKLQFRSQPPTQVSRMGKDHAAKDAFHACGLPENKVFSDAFDFADDPGLSAAQKEGKT